MKKIKLIRTSNSELVTLGTLINEESGLPICLTLEEPWLDNQENISCVPEGEYLVTPYVSPKNGNVYQLKDVPGRTYVQIHGGNTINDIEGCILLGSSYGYLSGLPAVLNSRVALDTFKAIMKSDPFILTIVGV